MKNLFLPLRHRGTEKKLIILCVFVSLWPILFSGCGQYTQVQMNLVQQARKGIELCTTATNQQSEQIQKYHTLKRQRLDEAFDADVKTAPKLSIDWVIEARKAYAVGLEALARDQASALQSLDAQQQNLKAIDQALQKLQWLQSIQMQWMIFDIQKEAPYVGN